MEPSEDRPVVQGAEVFGVADFGIAYNILGQDLVTSNHPGPRTAVLLVRNAENLAVTRFDAEAIPVLDSGHIGGKNRTPELVLFPAYRETNCFFHFRIAFRSIKLPKYSSVADRRLRSRPLAG